LKKDYIVFYSGGIGSWKAAKVAVEKHGKENVRCLFTDTLIEDNDLYRFLLETWSDIYQLERPYGLIERAKELAQPYENMNVCAEKYEFKYPGMVKRKEELEWLRKDANEYFGGSVIWLSYGIDPWDTYFQGRFLGNSRIAKCSHILKQKMAREWIDENTERENGVYYMGIDWTEEHRTAAPRKNWAPAEIEYPLCDMENFFSKDMLLSELDELGIEIPELYKLGFSHNNCFAGDERFITEEGLKTFKETEGQRVKVLGERAHWQDAEIKNFGQQEILELNITKGSRKRTIRTTANHRWFVRKNRKERITVITEDLKPGDTLWGMHQKQNVNVKPSAFGIAQGIVFGDGTYARNTWNNPATVTLCGEKQELLKYFPLQDVKEVKGVGVKVCDLPKFWKDHPNLEESKSFLLGWLMGYIATDGTVSKGSISISSSNHNDLELVQKICIKLGISFSEITSYDRKGLGIKESALYTLNLTKSTFKKEWLLRQKHKENFGGDAQKRPSEWMVESIKFTGEYEEVYCAVVPKGNAFTLEGNIYTSNCGGFCCKAGQGHFKNLVEKKPALYAYHEAREEELRQYLGKDVSMMKKTVNGETETLTMERLRKLYETGKSDAIDKNDIGGCGCFLSYEE